MKNWLTQPGLLFVGVIIIYSFIPVEPNVEVLKPAPETLFAKNINKLPYELKITDNILPPAYVTMMNAGLLIDLTTKEIIWQKNMDSRFPIASLTKMMVALLTLEEIKDGKIKWETNVLINEQAGLMVGSLVHIRKNEVYTVEELLKGAMISSGNDAAYQLADFLEGTQENFVSRMNDRARELGMSKTTFYNTTGLPSGIKGGSENTSSPSDLLLLVAELLKYDELLSMTGKPYDLLVKGKRIIKLRNHNLLVNRYPLIDGLKTGYTCKAGFCVALTAQIQNRRIVAIVLGTKNRNTRDEITVTMFKNYVAQLGDENEQSSTYPLKCL